MEISGWYMASTSNIDTKYRDAIGHIEGLTGLRYRALNETKWWCLDNSVFTGKFEESKWLTFQEKLLPWKDKCFFVTVPDVVGDFKSTLKQYKHYRKMVKNYPVALVSQDGIKDFKNKIPWDDLDFIFVGGTNEHKLGYEGKWISELAKEKGKGLHIGRVNSKKRMDLFWYADSWDGTKLSFAPSYVDKFYKVVLDIRKRKESM